MYRSRSRGWGIDLELLHMRLGHPSISAKYGSTVYGSLAKADGVNITHAEAIWILGTFRTSIILNN